MPSRARWLALPFAAGLWPMVAASAQAASGDAEPEGAAAAEPSDEPTPATAERPSGTKAAPKASPDGPAGKAKAKRLRGRLTADDDPRLSRRTDRKWIKRWAPERGMLEVGAFGGFMVPARDLELFEPRLGRPRQGFLPLATIAPDVGVRAGYYPLRFLGIEAEGAYVPTTTLDDGFGVQVFAARGHLVGQLPFASVAPFVVVGAGALGVRSNQLVVLGQDVDPAIHLGLGSKFFINRRIAARVDVRDSITPRRGVNGGATNTLEVLLGLSITLGRARDLEPQPEPEPEPEPTEAPDRDLDGFPDADDQCPDEPGVAPDGCPAPGDRDGDGFVDDEDTCPDEAGIAPDGCPDRDADHDGVLVPDDQCPDEPEAFNGFEDEDGCDDVVPDDLQRFGGTLEGINFELGKATLTPDSRTVLDEAVAVMLKYPNIRIGISGHTDNTGSRELNMSLSEKRAEAVKAYLVDKGVAADRMDTRGAGPDEPIDSNATKEGRANNRRIEFRVLN